MHKDSAVGKGRHFQEDNEEDPDDLDDGDIGFDQIQENRKKMMSKQKKPSRSRKNFAETAVQLNQFLSSNSRTV